MIKFYKEIILRFNEDTEFYEEVESKTVYVPDDMIISYCGGGDSGGGGTTSSTTVQKADPWSGQQPYLTYGFQQAQNLYNSPGPTYYPGSTVAPFSPTTQQAMNLTTQRALNGSPVENASANQITNTLNGNYFQPIGDLYNSPTMQASNQMNQNYINGDYLYGGQGFNAAYDAAAHRILPQVNSTFEGAGRTNSGLASVAQTQALSDAFANLYGQEQQNQLAAGNNALNTTNSLAAQIANERNNQLKATLVAPQIANQDYTDLSALQNVGSQQDALNQAIVNADVNRYDYGQNLPITKLQTLMNFIQGNYGGTTSTLSQQPFYQNQGASALGGAMSGYSVGSGLGLGPVGGIGGALIGGLLGGIF